MNDSSSPSSFFIGKGAAFGWPTRHKVASPVEEVAFEFSFVRLRITSHSRYRMKTSSLGFGYDETPLYMMRFACKPFLILKGLKLVCIVGELMCRG